MAAIALISCVKEKLDHPAPAKDMYIGSGFKDWLKDASFREITKIYILSGKYGLLELDQNIEPYDVNLSDQDPEYRKQWYEDILQKLRAKHDLINDHYILYTNRTYYEGLIDSFGSYEIPFEIE